MIHIILFIIIIIGNILGIISFGKLSKGNKQSHNLVLDDNNDQCKYCRGIDGIHYHIEDRKLYKTENRKTTGKECELCKNNPNDQHIHMI